MTRLKTLLVATALAGFGVIGGSAAPANATHACGFEDPLVNTVCEYGPHDPKGALVYIFCWFSPTC